MTDEALENPFIRAYPRIAIDLSDRDYIIGLLKEKSRIWDIGIAYHILICESNGNPNAINYTDNHKTCSGSYGLFQLSCDKGSVEDLLNPDKNIQIAYELWLKNGWEKDWVNCSK